MSICSIRSHREIRESWTGIGALATKNCIHYFSKNSAAFNNVFSFCNLKYMKITKLYLAIAILLGIILLMPYTDSDKNFIGQFVKDPIIIFHPTIIKAQFNPGCSSDCVLAGPQCTPPSYPVSGFCGPVTNGRLCCSIPTCNVSNVYDYTSTPGNTCYNNNGVQVWTHTNSDCTTY